MKTAIRFQVSLLVLFALSACLACRVPLQTTGGATLSLTIGGVIPPASLKARFGRGVQPEPSDPRLIVPGATNIRVSVTIDGVALTAIPTLSGGVWTAAIADLPVGATASIVVEALGSGGAVVTRTQAAISVELVEGNNSVSATLLPAEAPVDLGTIGSADFPNAQVVLASSLTLAQGGVGFYKVAFGADVAGEHQILFDTGKARWAWLGAYDRDWKPLPTVCSDQAQGWAVLSLTSGVDEVYLAVANIVSSPGYTAGALSGMLQARRARFSTPTGSGDGTSASPAALANFTWSGESLFMAGGSYGISSRLSLSVVGASPGAAPRAQAPGLDTRIYGGFSADWKNRNSETVVSKTLASADPLLFYQYASTGTVDGVTLRAGPIDMSYQESVCILVETAYRLVINNCDISGNMAAPYDGGAVSSTGLQIRSGLVEVANSTLRGGYAASSAGNATTRALYLSATNPDTSTYIHGCDIDGGLVTSDSEAMLASYGIDVGSLDQTVVVSGCRVWGGTAQGQYAGATLTGVNVPMADVPSKPVHIANSVISSGYADVNSSTSSGLSIGRPDVVRVYGCVLDGGMGPPSSGNFYAAQLDSGADPALASIMLFVSTIDSGSHFAIYDTAPSTTQASARDIVTLGGAYQWWDGATAAPFPAAFLDTVDLPTVAPADYFQNYLATYSGEPGTYFGTWLTGNLWKASSAYASSVAGVSNPNALGLVTPELSAAYPALMFDLAGRARPTSGAWKRGAYE